MAERAQTTSGSGTGSLLRSMAKKALAPLVSSVIHAASAYLGQKAGELAQQKLVPKLQERSAGKQQAEDGDSSSGSSRDAQRRGREDRRSKRREALEHTGST
jgi:hypothetical protein